MPDIFRFTERLTCDDELPVYRLTQSNWSSNSAKVLAAEELFGPLIWIETAGKTRIRTFPQLEQVKFTYPCSKN